MNKMKKNKLKFENPKDCILSQYRDIRNTKYLVVSIFGDTKSLENCMNDLLINDLRSKKNNENV